VIIKIKNLKIDTVIGVYEFEKKRKRPIILNFEIELHAQEVADDDLANTIDYDKVASIASEISTDYKYNLIETLAQKIIEQIMLDKKIKRCKLEIDKPKAVKDAESVSATFEAFS
jgi:dihydroneopterin aldolase